MAKKKKSVARKPVARKKTVARKKAVARKKKVAGKAAARKSAARKTAARKTVRSARSTASRAADRARVSKQPSELAYVARKFGVGREVVLKAIARAGNMRTAVYAALKTYKARSRAADRAKVSRQPHEVAHLVRKFGTTSEAVLAALDSQGSSRKKVEAALAANAPAGQSPTGSPPTGNAPEGDAPAVTPNE
jgi:histone H1/5